METVSASAKITRPTPGGSLPRERLFRKLDEARKRPVVWISAPAGSGKTTLVSGYVDSRQLGCLWYQVDSGDADLATSFFYLGVAGKQAAPHIPDPLPLLTPEYRLGVPEFSRNFFEALFGRLRPPCVLVLDDYHEVPEEAPFHRALLEALTRLRQGMTLIVVSRGPPPTPFARLRANRQMATLEWADLRLTLEEFEEIFGLQDAGSQVRQAMEHLYRRVDGWAAGVQLVLETVKTQSIDPLNLVEGTPEEVFDYFTGEVFDRLDEETKDFLLKTSFLPSMTSSMAERLTGHPRSDRLLSYLNRNNDFTEKRLQAEPVYRYHPLFREFLADRARQTFSAREIKDIQGAAAALLDEAGRSEEAASLLREVGDWQRLAGLILRNAATLVSQGRGQTLESWLGGVPHDVLGENPWLLFWLGQCRMPYDLRESRDHLERAFRAFKSQGDCEGAFLAWAAVIDTFVYEWGDFRPLDRWIAEVEALLKHYPEFPSPEVEARVTAGVFAALMYRQTHHPQFPLWEERLRTIVVSSPELPRRMLLGNQLLLYHAWWTGDFAKAELLVRALRPAAESGRVDPLTLVAWYAIQAGFYWNSGRMEESLALVDKGLAVATDSGVHLWDFMLFVQGVYATRSMGDLDAAEKYLEGMAQVLDSACLLDVVHYHYHVSWVALLRGNLPSALEHGQLALDTAVRAGSPFPEAVTHVGLGKVLVRMGEYARAEDLIDKGHGIACRIGSKVCEYLALMARAELASARGDEPGGLEALRQGLAIARERRFVNDAWWWPPFVTDFCLTALEHDIEVPFVQDWIRQWHLVPEKPPLHLDNWPWPLRVYTLGRFEIVRGDEPIRFSRKAQQRPLALLKAVIALGGRKVSVERLLDALWPDADGDLAHQSFAIALHRLRKLLGVKEALVQREGRLTLDARYCWVDAWALERLLTQAESAPIDQAVGLAEKADALYHGAFLPQDIDQPWAVPLRERLRNRFLRIVETLGRHLEKNRRWEDAAQRYRKALEVDPLAEELCRRLMVCYRELGRNAEALAVYTRFRKVLSRLLGTTPSPETEALRQSLKHPTP